MKIKKSRIEEIIKEELATHLNALLIAEGPAEVATADDENRKDDQPTTPSKNSAPTVGGNIDNEQQGEPEEDKGDKIEVPAGDDPADDKISKDVEEPEAEDEKGIGGDISNALTGKQVQSISMEPESKMMPGAREITLQFESDPHPLKILLGKSGMIKFHYRGSLHNEL